MREFVDIPMRLEMFWTAWNALSSCRPQAFSGLAPIPWTAIDSYVRRLKLSDEEFDLCVFFCRELDGELMEYHKRKQA